MSLCAYQKIRRALQALPNTFWELFRICFFRAAMTRLCMRCEQIVGEKCARCGAQMTVNSNDHALTDAEFDCPSCGHHFMQGDGGETGGLCTPCLEDQLQKAYVEAAKTQRRRSELAAGKSSRKGYQGSRRLPQLQKVGSISH